MSELVRELLARERLSLMVGLSSLTSAKKTASKLIPHVGDALVYIEEVDRELELCLEELEFLSILAYLKREEVREPPCLRATLARKFRYRGVLSDEYLRPRSLEGREQ